MGVERDDAAAAKPRRSGTEPGLGGIPAGSGHGAAAEPIAEPEAVDFDALHAALGDPLALDELPAEQGDAYDDYDEHHHEDGEPESDAHEDEEPSGEEEEEEGDEPHDYEGGESEEPHVGESDGRSSAHYASSRPHTIPPSHAPTEDMNAPPVIVASEDIGATVPSGPPVQMTKPINQTRPIALTPLSGVPFVNQPATSAHASGPHAVAAVAPYGEAAPFEATAAPAYPRSASQMTVRMPDRPVAPAGTNPRRGKIQTLVVRPRGPSLRQKLFAFMAMLLLVTACGIAVVIWRWRPGLVGLDTPPPAPSAMPAPPVPSAAPLPQAEATATSTAAPSMTAAPSASISARPKPKAPPPPPAVSPR